MQVVGNIAVYGKSIENKQAYICLAMATSPCFPSNRSVWYDNTEMRTHGAPTVPYPVYKDANKSKNAGMLLSGSFLFGQGNKATQAPCSPREILSVLLRAPQSKYTGRLVLTRHAGGTRHADSCLEFNALLS